MCADGKCGAREVGVVDGKGVKTLSEFVTKVMATAHANGLAADVVVDGEVKENEAGDFLIPLSNGEAIIAERHSPRHQFIKELVDWLASGAEQQVSYH